MANTNTDFVIREIAQFAKASRRAINETVRGAALDMFGQYIANTPVGEKDSGTLRANWQAQIGSAATGELSAQDKTGGATIGKANAVLESYDGTRDIYFSNNLPYAEVAELGLWGQGPYATDRTVGGYSSQAPNGIVAPVNENFSNAVERLARENEI